MTASRDQRCLHHYNLVIDYIIPSNQRAKPVITEQVQSGQLHFPVRLDKCFNFTPLYLQLKFQTNVDCVISLGGLEYVKIQN